MALETKPVIYRGNNSVELKYLGQHKNTGNKVTDKDCHICGQIPGILSNYAPDKYFCAVCELYLFRTIVTYCPQSLYSIVLSKIRGLRTRSYRPPQRNY